MKKQVLEHDFGIPMSQELEGGINEMSSIGDSIERRGIAEGIARGRAEGRTEGRAEGRIETLLSNIKNLINNTGWPLEQAMKTLGVPQEEWPQFTELLAEQ